MDKTGPIVFVHLQKTGGQTIRQILRNHFGTTQCDLQDSPWRITEEQLQFIRRFYPNLQCLTGHACMPWNPTGRIPNARHFAFFRKPIERTVSSYLYLTRIGKRPQDFESWLETERNKQVMRLADAEDLEKAKAMLSEPIQFVGLLERFDESLLLWQNWLSSSVDIDIRYRLVNVSKDMQLKEEILGNESWMNRIHEATRLDQQLYDYVAEELYPKQCEAYEGDLEKAVADFRATLPAERDTTFRNHLGRMKRNLLFRPIWKAIGRR